MAWTGSFFFCHTCQISSGMPCVHRFPRSSLEDFEKPLHIELTDAGLRVVESRWFGEQLAAVSSAAYGSGKHRAQDHPSSALAPGRHQVKSGRQRIDVSGSKREGREKSQSMASARGSGIPWGVPPSGVRSMQRATRGTSVPVTKQRGPPIP